MKGRLVVKQAPDQSQRDGERGFDRYRLRDKKTAGSNHQNEEDKEQAQQERD